MGFSVIPEPAVSGLTGPAGPAGEPGVIQSVNGKSAATVTLDAADVNALPSTGNATLKGQYLWLDTAAGTYRAFGYRTAGVDRWLFQVDDLAESGNNLGSNFRLSARNDDGSFNKTVVYARRDSGQIAFSTTAPHGSATATVNGSVGLKDVDADPSTFGGGVFLYSKGGVPYIKQADGTVFQVTPGGGGGGGAVQSVNGKTGAVTLGATDVNALPVEGGTLTGALKAPAFNTDSTQRSAFFKTTSTTQHAATIYQAGTSGVDVAAALNVTSDNPESSSMYLSGKELNRGTLKISHTNGGALATDDAGAAALSIDLKRGGKPGTAAQAVFINATEGPTTGNLFTARNGGERDEFVVTADGRLGLRMDIGEKPEAVLEVKPGDATTPGLAMTGVSGGQQLVLLKDSTGAARFEVTASGATVHRATSFFTSPIQGGSTSLDIGGASGFVLGMKDVTTAPSTNPTGGVIAYSQGGQFKVRQADGSIVTPGDIPSSFTPESIGLKAWAGDPATCAAGSDYCGVGRGRMTAVYVSKPMSVSKIAWHMFGYAGGLLAGSWAGIYNTAGTLQRATGDLSTAAYEPGEQHGVGGAVSTSNLTSPVTLQPGVYYVIWRFNYTASPVDGPALMRFDSSSTCAGVYGATSVRRFGAFTTTATSAPSTLTPSWEADPIRFWAALA